MRQTGRAGRYDEHDVMYIVKARFRLNRQARGDNGDANEEIY